MKETDMALRSIALVALLIGVATPAVAAEARQSTFGRLPDGRAVPAITLTNKAGISATIIAYGATLQALMMPDRNGKRADVMLGYDGIDDYLKTPQYFGATVGRFANRIARGRFTLDGRDYRVPVNNGKNSLHGGTVGFDKVLWSVVSVKSGPTASVTLRYVSKDGDQGYPGTMTVDATYSLDEKNALSIEYTATTDNPGQQLSADRRRGDPDRRVPPGGWHRLRFPRAACRGRAGARRQRPAARLWPRL